MQIASFLAHYQLVYINFDLSSFFLISCTLKKASLAYEKPLVAAQLTVSCKGVCMQLIFSSERVACSEKLSCIPLFRNLVSHPQ